MSSIKTMLLTAALCAIAPRLALATEPANLSVSGSGTCAAVQGQFPATIGSYAESTGTFYGIAFLIGPIPGGDPQQYIIQQLAPNNTLNVISGGIFPNASGTWSGSITPAFGGLVLKNVTTVAGGCTLVINGISYFAGD